MISYKEVEGLLKYDSQTGYLYWKVNNGRARAGNEAGSVSTLGYIMIGINKKLYYGHRIAWLLHYGEWPKNDIVHINSSKTDNRIINYIKSNKKMNRIMETIIYYSCDFHDKIHHDTSINKKPLNWFMEFFQNLLMEGGGLILFAQWCNFSINIKNFKFKLNRSVLLLWGLLYASVHNINYILLGCNQHTNHHIDPKTNYGIDTLDILFDTKYDINNIENINHGAINMVVITLIVWYFKIYM